MKSRMYIDGRDVTIVFLAAALLYMFFHNDSVPTQAAVRPVSDESADDSKVRHVQFGGSERKAG